MVDDQFVKFAQESYISNLCTVAVTALLAYEWVITLCHEVEFFWKASFTGATMLFALNRYIIALSYAILYLPPPGSSSRKDGLY
ncbi:hypothetical protein C8Q80DRAFT_317808 [Daedaleopsis nitida]|nr:hypothetical protein C8Q80DRAFT_317808 [Daedaleopsis nitida]